MFGIWPTKIKIPCTGRSSTFPEIRFLTSILSTSPSGRLDAVNCRVVQDLDFRVLLDAFLKDLRAAEFVASVDQRDLLRKFGQVRGFFEGGVSAADDCDIHVSEEVCVAGGAVGDAQSAQFSVLPGLRGVVGVPGGQESARRRYGYVRLFRR